MIRVLLVDDHPTLREGLKRIFTDTCDIRVVAEAGDGPEALAAWRAQPIDVVLLDLELPSTSGREVLRTMLEERPGTRVLIFSLHSDAIYAQRLMAAGARGYLRKDQDPDEIIRAVRQIHISGAHLTPEQTTMMVVGRRPGEAANPLDRLSERELEVLTRLAKGQRKKRVAGDLGVTPQSISTYISRIVDKLGLRDSSELFRWFDEVLSYRRRPHVPGDETSSCLEPIA